ncbi:MAG: HAMP domain-containing histidine kinase, partial [Mogibacterium sp.]|nr:HAMP domain-containing histidine kinase [Mogibacterium sp.]
LLVLIWCLQNLFINNYYEEMKSEETRKTAAMLENEYLRNPGSFAGAALTASVNNGVFIRLDDENGISIYDSGTYLQPSTLTYNFEISSVRKRLHDSGRDSVSVIFNDASTETHRLVYGTYLGDPGNDALLFIVAPLYPVQSTISILRAQLLYISVIALFIALLLAMVMSTRLSSPIKSITKSAVELSKGNYNVKFNGGMFTETNELARTLNKASYEMQKTDFYQKDLIANVSHDLKTPLTMIKSYAEMIHDISGDNPEKRNQHLNVIISEADRLNKLVSDMLSASRLQSNSVELNKTTFDFIEVAQEVADTFLVLNDQDNYNIFFIPCKSTYVYGDADKIKQVMTNLISNAVKYCGEDKFIKIEVKRVSTGRKIRFDVVDHGEGIAEDEIAHVWERYYRTSANYNRDIEGTGLGLSIVKGILALHNANYGVESKVGQGSDFWFEMETVKK